MDSSRDNAFTRFATFWWALGTFLLFGVLIAVVWLFNRQAPDTLEDLAAQARYKNKEEVFKAQEAALDPAALDKAIESVGKQLLGSKPVASTDNKDVVPGSPTAIKIAEGGSDVDIEGVNKAAEEAANEPVDPAVVEAGKAAFLLCAACHGQNGEGTPAGPPLANSEWVTGPVSNLLLIQMRGLEGPITIAGKEYTFPAPMAAMGAAMPDDQVAAVLTYVRNSFGNKASAVKPEWVKAFRGETGKPPLKTSELLPAAK